VSDSAPDPDSFEARLRAFAKELSESAENAAERLDFDRLADSVNAVGERVREAAEFAGQWLSGQAQARDDADADDDADAAARRRRVGGPHPLDVPTEEQALALGALESGRWEVQPGTNELVSEGSGPSPDERVGLVSELRARDWIAAGGEVTQLGRDALRRWSDAAGS
jgi:hypothetical protein